MILTVSEFSKRSIEEFCDRYQIKSPPVIVTYEGVEVSTPREKIARTKEDYVVHLASRLPSKATTWLLEQWRSLVVSGKELPELRLVGDLNGKAREVLSKITRVTHVPPMERSELENVLAKARALLLPSEIEGFGIPAAEAYLLGTPVVYAKETAVEEIIGTGSPGGFYRDRDSFEAALSQVLELDKGWVKKKGEALKQLYNWKDCVDRTLNAYKSVLRR